MHIYAVGSCSDTDRGVARGVLGGGLESTYSENRVGHSENYANNSRTKF